MLELNLPAAQDVQSLSASFPVAAVLNLPAGQGMHLLSASLPEVVILYLPAPQDSHVLSRLLPEVVILYLPAPQFKHLLSASLPEVVILYLPAPQFKQVAAAAREYLPAPQFAQTSAWAPVLALNLPASQDWCVKQQKFSMVPEHMVNATRTNTMHTPSSSTQQAAVKPKVWRITVQTELTTIFPAGQSVQVRDAVSDDLPAGQALHAASFMPPVVSFSFRCLLGREQSVWRAFNYRRCPRTFQLHRRRTSS